MCGRFALNHSPHDVEALFDLADIEPFPPRYNIAPTQPVLVVRSVPPRPVGSNLPDRETVLMRWGLLPAWVKEPDTFPLLINARSETAATKSAFRGAMRHRRCIIPASGFYEWKRHKPSRLSQAYWVTPAEGGVIGFAALWETWSARDGSEVDTCAILTTAAPQDLASIHHRVPVPLAPADHARWLDSRTYAPADVSDLLTTPPSGLYRAVPVSDRVNKVANTDASLQKPVEPKDFTVATGPALAKDRPGGDDDQPTLF